MTWLATAPPVLMSMLTFRHAHTCAEGGAAVLPGACPRAADAAQAGRDLGGYAMFSRRPGGQLGRCGDLRGGRADMCRRISASAQGVRWHGTV